LLHPFGDEFVLKTAPILLEILNNGVDIRVEDAWQFSVVLIEVRQGADFVLELVLQVVAFEELFGLVVVDLVFE